LLTDSTAARTKIQKAPVGPKAMRAVDAIRRQYDFLAKGCFLQGRMETFNLRQATGD